MKNKNIHWIDSVLIWSGSALLVALLLSSGAVISAGGNQGGQILAAVFVAGGILGAIAAIATGVVIRRKENRMIVIWNILENTAEVSVSDLEMNTGFDRRFIEESVRIINTKGLGYFVLDRKHDTIVDGWLRTTMLTVADCPSCGGHIDQQVPLDMSVVPRCGYCDRPVSVDHLNRLKSALVNEIRRDAPTAVSGKQAKGFNVGIFLFLLFIFWPFGVAYAAWKSGVFQNTRTTWQV